MVRVAFQGEHGAFSEIAASALWPGASSVPCRDNVDVVRAVARGDVDVGVLPIENSVAGTVTATLDALLESDGICITAETVVPIDLCLLGVPGAALADVRRVESHEVALAQCRAFLDRHPALEPWKAYDTAGAARDIALAGDRTRAAIASAGAAERYGLTVLQPALQDSADNRTRFIGLSRNARRKAGASPCRTSLAVTIDTVGDAFTGLLDSIAHAGMHVTRFDGTPADPPARHRFVLEVKHPADDTRLGAIIAALDAELGSCRILGTFAVAEAW